MASSRNGICVMSSRLMVAPILSAMTNSSAGVSLEENIISLPLKPQASLIISSVREEQSVPQPSSFRICRIFGVGVALTAKYSRNPLFQENASYSLRAFSRIPFSSYKCSGVGYSFTIASACSLVINGFFSFIGLNHPFLSISPRTGRIHYFSS